MVQILICTITLTTHQLEQWLVNDQRFKHNQKRNYYTNNLFPFAVKHHQRQL